MERLTQGPMIEETMLTAGMDYYKPTMSQLQFEKHADKEVTFTFKNRGEQRIADYVDANELQAQLDFIRERGWAAEELDYLATLCRPDGERVFTDAYLNYLADNELPEVRVTMDEAKDDIAIETTGQWPLVTFWETVAMGQVSEMYFANYIRAHNLDIDQIYAEGDRRFNVWVDYLQEHPDVKVSEFGTRRRFSLRWQKHITERLVSECPENIIGTSNIALANTVELHPIGTFAHEMPMVYAGIADAEGSDMRASHHQMLRDWKDRYPHLDTALSDTFTSDFFFEDFADQAYDWRALRHDSGDPLEFAAKALAFYEERGIKSETKTIVFSDSLDVDTVKSIHEAVKSRIGDAYGVGTKFTNDLGLKALNVVMKATRVRLPDARAADTVKLSDNAGKHTGPDAAVRRYETVFHTVAGDPKQLVA